MMRFVTIKKVLAFSFMALLGQSSFSPMAMAIDDIEELFSSLGVHNKPAKMNYYLEDPSVMMNLGQLTTNITTNLLGKPQLTDKDITIVGSPKANKDGNFIFKTQTKDFDKASAFATVRTAMNMYRGDLGALAKLYPSDTTLKNVVKYWDSGTYGQLHVTTEAGNDANAYYNRSGKKRELKFFTFEGDNKEIVHSCRSSDVVAHETGHSMLDIIHPEYFDTDNLQTGGYHESFGDQTAIFWTLYHTSLCTKLITDTKGNLHQRENNFLAALAEQFGEALGMPNGLRNADDDVMLKDAEPEVHAISTVYTGAMYDVLASAYHEATADVSDPAQQVVKLYDVGQQFRQMNIQSLVSMTNPEPNFTDFAFALDTVAKQRAQSGQPTALDSLNWSSYINAEFTRRGIPVVANGNLGLDDLTVKKVRLCGTVVHKHGHK